MMEQLALHASVNFWEDLSLEVTSDGLGGGEDCEGKEAGSIILHKKTRRQNF